MSILGKTFEDNWTFYAYIKDFGWIEFEEASRANDNRILLKRAKFLSTINHDLLENSAHDRGVEVQLDSIVLLIDKTS